MTRAITHTHRRTAGSPTADAACPAAHTTFGVSAPYADGLDATRPFAVTSRIGSISRTDRYAAARGAAQLRRDLALLAGRVGRRL